MSYNGGYYQAQGQQPVYQQQPQNIYQQLGKAQPQPHLQQQSQGFQYPHAQQSPPSPYPPSQTPYPGPSPSPYSQPQTPYPPSQTPYIPSQTPFAPPPPQPSPFAQYQPQPPYAPAQTPYPLHQQPPPQQPHYSPVHQQPPTQHGYNPNLPVSSFPGGGGSAPFARPVSTFRPPPVSPSATLAQQVRAQTVPPPTTQMQQPPPHLQQQQPQKQQQQQPQPMGQPIQTAFSQQMSQQQLQQLRIQQQERMQQMASSANAKLPPSQQPQAEPQVEPSPTTSSARRPLPQPAPGANAQTPALPPVLQRVPGLAGSAPGSVSNFSGSGITNAASTITSSANQTTTTSRTNKPFPQPISSSSSSASSPTKTPGSPIRNSRPLPTPSGAPDTSSGLGNLNKRATVDLGKLPSSFNATGGASSTSNSIFPRAQSQSPTKGFTNDSYSKLAAGSSNSTTAGLSRTSTYAANTDNNGSVQPKRRASPPRFNSHSQSSSGASSPAKEGPSTPSTPGWARGALPQFGNAASTSAPPNLNSTTANQNGGASASSNSTADTALSTPKKFTPMWKRTIPEVRAPVWGYAAGMVKEPHPTAPPAVAQTRSSSSSPTKMGSSSGGALSGVGGGGGGGGRTGSSSPTKVGYAPPQQQQGRSQQGYPYAGASRAQNQHRGPPGPETEVETEATEATEDDDYEDGYEEEDPRYAVAQRHTQPQPPAMRHRKVYSQPLASDAVGGSREGRNGGGGGGKSRSRSGGRYTGRSYSYEQYRDDDDEDDDDQEDEDDDDPTPRRRPAPHPRSRPGSSSPTKPGSGPKSKILRPKNKVDPYDGYEDVSPIGSGFSRMKIRARGDRDAGSEGGAGGGGAGGGGQERKRILRRDEVEFVVRKGDGSGDREAKQVKHQRSWSAIEERERKIMQARKGKAGGRPRSGSAFARRGYEDEDEDEDDEQDEGGGRGLAYDDEYEEDEESELDDRRRRRVKKGDKEQQWGGRDAPPRNVSAGSAGYYPERGQAYGQERGAGLPQPPAMVRDGPGQSQGPGQGERKVQGGPRWKPSTSPSASSVASPYEEHNQMRGRSDSRMSGMSGVSAATSGGGAWPVDLPRLPRTPASVADNGGGGYFDVRPPSTTSSASGHARGYGQTPHSPAGSNFEHNNSGRRGGGNLDLDDPPPRASVVRTPSPGPAGGYKFQRRPQSQVFDASAPSASGGAVPPQRRPQSQIYGNSASSSVTYGQHRQPQQHAHPPSFGNGLTQPHHSSSSSSPRKHPQTPAPPPTVGIESPHPVGGRDRLADIPKLEEDSNDGSDAEARSRRVVSPPTVSVSVPSISVDAPMINVEPPVINVGMRGGGGPPASPRNGGAPKIQVFEVPGVSVSGPDFDYDDGGGGLMINVSGPEDHNHHHNHNHGQGQQSRQQPRPPQHQHQQQHQHQHPPAPPSGPGSRLACGGCHAPITNGRIVSAMGMRWHPSCFQCSVCGTLLEHVSSYEHEGRAYCHLDYHENFAPRCYSCETAIIDEQFISLDDPALGRRTYHTQHFFCSECGDPFLDPSAPLSTGPNGEHAVTGDGDFEGFTVYKGYPYCEKCHVRLRLPKCKRCKKPIRDRDEAVEALGGKWCWACFTCASCDKPFEDPSFFQRGDQPYCEPCFSIMLRNEV